MLRALSLMTEGFRPMLVAAMRTAFVTSGTKVDREKRGVVLGRALRAASPSEERAAGAELAEGKVGEQSQTEDEEEQQPELIGREPECFAQSGRVPDHEQNRKIEEPMQRRRTRQPEKEPGRQSPKRDRNKRADPEEREQGKRRAVAWAKRPPCRARPAAWAGIFSRWINGPKIAVAMPVVIIAAR